MVWPHDAAQCLGGRRHLCFPSASGAVGVQLRSRFLVNLGVAPIALDIIATYLEPRSVQWLSRAHVHHFRRVPDLIRRVSGAKAARLDDSNQGEPGDPAMKTKLFILVLALQSAWFLGTAFMQERLLRPARSSLPKQPVRSTRSCVKAVPRTHALCSARTRMNNFGFHGRVSRVTLICFINSRRFFSRNTANKIRKTPEIDEHQARERHRTEQADVGGDDVQRDERDAQVHEKPGPQLDADLHLQQAENKNGDGGQVLIGVMWPNQCHSLCCGTKFAATSKAAAPASVGAPRHAPLLRKLRAGCGNRARRAVRPAVRARATASGSIPSCRYPQLKNPAQVSG